MENDSKKRLFHTVVVQFPEQFSIWTRFTIDTAILSGSRKASAVYDRTVGEKKVINNSIPFLYFL